jgi:amino-acid N-acetyltransferase
MEMSAVCRKASAEDVDAMYAIIQNYAEKGIMLPRSRQMIERHLDSFVVAEADGEVVGCGSLFVLGSDLVEIRSLGVDEKYQGRGIGGKLVEYLTGEAGRKGIPKVMALTYEVEFFRKHGFEVVQKEIFPEKVWTDCIHCKKQHHCDEIAVLKILN